MTAKACLWRSAADGKCVTMNDVDEAIMVARWELDEDSLEDKWVRHPQFKKMLIDMGKDEKSYPSTLIETSLSASENEDMKSNLKRWGREKRR